jgi:hypothetical protein
MIAGQIKLNLKLLPGEPVSLRIEDHHLYRRRNLFALPCV